MITVDNLTIRLGSFSLADVSFEVPTGEYGILMGKTGCGKTTILEAICGLKPITAGTIHLMGRDVTRAKPAERGIGFVPQDAALFTTMTIRDQLAFSLTIRKCDRPAISKRVDELADLLGIRHLLDRKPKGLSGGETQRVALGRALAAKPDILCLDEPLSALDDETRDEMYDLIESVRETTGVTTLHITHNISEGKRLADKLYVLRNGRVQNASSDEIEKHRPANTQPVSPP